MAEAEKKKGGIWSRRDFFTRLGWGGFGVFGGLGLLGFLRSAFPRVLFQPPSTFKAGFPSDYAIGEVSEKYKQDQRVWIVREETGVHKERPGRRLGEDRAEVCDVCWSVTARGDEQREQPWRRTPHSREIGRGSSQPLANPYHGRHVWS